MADIKFSEFPKATTSKDSDEIAILQGGVNKMIPSPVLESKIINKTVSRVIEQGGASLNIINPISVVPTYADLDLITPTPSINDAYQVEADGLVYVYTENGFQSDGDGFVVQPEPTGVVEEGNIKAVSGETVFKYIPKEYNSSNLFDFETVINDYYIDVDGNFSPAGGWYYSAPITVEPNKVYNKKNAAGAFYTESGDFIQRIPAAQDIFTSPANATVFRMTNPVDNILSAMFEEGETPTTTELGNKKISSIMLPPSVLSRKGNNIIISKNGGGNFRHINDALDWLRNNNEDNAQNPFTFELIDGIYTESVNLCGLYVSLVGRNKENCIIRTFTNDYYNPPIDMAGNNHLFNLTVIADDDGVTTPPNGLNNMPAYGIHFDIASRYESLGIRVQGRSVVKNCRIISIHQHAVGQGLWTDQFSIWDDCEFISINNPAFRSHSYLPAGATGQKFLMRNSVIHNGAAHPPIVIQDANLAGGQDATDTVYSFQNNVAYNGNGQTGDALLQTHDIVGQGTLSGRIKLGLDSFGNNIPKLNAYTLS